MNSAYLLHNINRLKKELESGYPDFDNYKIGSKILELIFNKDTKLNGSVYRASFIPFSEFSKPIYPHRFSYPNPKRGITVNKGRANIGGFPICYVGQNIFGAIIELLLTGSNNSTWGKWRTVYVSEWRVKPNVLSRMYSAKNRLPYNAKGFGSHEIITYNKYFKLLEECFLVENAYEFSSKLCHHLLYERGPAKPEMDLIKYPSVVDRKICKEFKIKQPPELECINFAIHPNFFDSHYEFVEAIAFNIPDNFEKQLPNYFKESRMDLYFLGKAVIDKSYTDGRLCYQA